MTRPSDEAVEALLELKFQVAELFEPGMWRESPGGDKYFYEGPMSLIDSVLEAYETVDGILIMEQDDEEEPEL